jgi:hypothetical protein
VKGSAYSGLPRWWGPANRRLYEDLENRSLRPSTPEVDRQTSAQVGLVRPRDFEAAVRVAAVRQLVAVDEALERLIDLAINVAWELIGRVAGLLSGVGGRQLNSRM